MNYCGISAFRLAMNLLFFVFVFPSRGLAGSRLLLDARSEIIPEAIFQGGALRGARRRGTFVFAIVRTVPSVLAPPAAAAAAAAAAVRDVRGRVLPLETVAAAGGALEGVGAAEGRPCNALVLVEAELSVAG